MLEEVRGVDTLERYEQAGLMTDHAIREAMSNNHMLIYPFDEKNLTPVGYNFTFSNFIISLSSKAFVNLITDFKTGDVYFYLRPNETVLVLTRETIWVNKSIGGTFHSKVSLVTQGLGHISTTLDPGWRGQLLAPLNNPTKHKVKVVVSRPNPNIRDGKGIDECKNIPCSFITLVMYRCLRPADKSGDNKPARLELLEKILLSNKRSAKRIELAKIIATIGEHFNEYSSINLYDGENPGEGINKGLDAESKEDREYATEEYIYRQRLLNTTLHNRYLDVVKANRSIILGNKLKFTAWVVLFLLVGVGITIGCTLYNNILFAPILSATVAFFLFGLNKLIERYF